MSEHKRRGYIKPWRLPEDDLFYRPATRLEIIYEFIDDRLLSWFTTAVVVLLFLFLFFPETAWLVTKAIINFWR